MKAILRITTLPLSEGGIQILKDLFGEDIEIITTYIQYSDDPVKDIYNEFVALESNGYNVIAIEPTNALPHVFAKLIGGFNIPIIHPAFIQDEIGRFISKSKDKYGMSIYEISHYEVIEGVRLEIDSKPL
ncbi:MAG: hypothetical protein ACOCQD_00725 [archaeon]